MTQEQILNEINRIFRDVLDDENLKIGMDTRADDVEDWDSLTHIQLVVAIEKHFKVKFNASEIQGWKNAGDMVRSVSNKLPNS